MAYGPNNDDERAAREAPLKGFDDWAPRSRSGQMNSASQPGGIRAGDSERIRRRDPDGIGQKSRRAMRGAGPGHGFPNAGRRTPSTPWIAIRAVGSPYRSAAFGPMDR